MLGLRQHRQSLSESQEASAVLAVIPVQQLVHIMTQPSHPAHNLFFFYKEKPKCELTQLVSRLAVFKNLSLRCITLNIFHLFSLMASAPMCPHGAAVITLYVQLFLFCLVESSAAAFSIHFHRPDSDAVYIPLRTRQCTSTIVLRRKLF